MKRVEVERLITVGQWSYVDLEHLARFAMEAMAVLKQWKCDGCIDGIRIVGTQTPSGVLPCEQACPKCVNRHALLAEWEKAE